MKSKLLFAAMLLFAFGCSTKSTSSPPPTVAASPSNESGSTAQITTGGTGEGNPSAAPSAAGVKPSGGEPATEASKPAPVPIEAGSVKIGPANTTIQFVGTHMPPAAPDPRVGVFTEFTGKIVVNPETKSLVSVNVEIKTESLETAFPPLTNHLRSPDFFDARQYPTAKFESTSISSTEGEPSCEIVGKLTLLQATKEVRIPAKVTVSDAGLLLTGDFNIDRNEFGMTGQDKVSKDVAMTVSVGQKTAAPKGGAFSMGGGGGARKEGPATNAAVVNKSEGLAIFHQRDTDKNGKLTGDEIVGKMKENLSAIDTDGDGAISEEEFQKRQTPIQPSGKRRGPGGGRGTGAPKGKDAAPPASPETETPK